MNSSTVLTQMYSTHTMTVHFRVHVAVSLQAEDYAAYSCSANLLCLTSLALWNLRNQVLVEHRAMQAAPTIHSCSVIVMQKNQTVQFTWNRGRGKICYGYSTKQCFHHVSHILQSFISSFGCLSILLVARSCLFLLLSHSDELIAWCFPDAQSDHLIA